MLNLMARIFNTFVYNLKIRCVTLEKKQKSLVFKKASTTRVLSIHFYHLNTKIK